MSGGLGLDIGNERKGWSIYYFSSHNFIICRHQQITSATRTKLQLPLFWQVDVSLSADDS